MKHELRMIPHMDAAQWIGAQPYCVCGWVGEPEHASLTDSITERYLEHIESQNAIYRVLLEAEKYEGSFAANPGGGNFDKVKKER